MTNYCCPSLPTQSTTGSLLAGGGAIVSIADDAWDGMAGLWPLNELGDGTEDEFQDRTRNELHGQGGDGTDIALVPVRDQGVFCQPSQHFVERQFITLPPDHLSMSQGFTVSLWGKIETFYQPRIFFSRGHTTPDGDEWVFTIGHTFLNWVTASVQTLALNGTKTTYTAYGATTLAQNQFYHLAASWTPELGLKLYVNGVQDGTFAVSDVLLQPLTNESYFSKWNGGGYLTGNVQDVRLHAEPKSAAWLLAEFQNYCLNGFFVVGDEQTPTH